MKVHAIEYLGCLGNSQNWQHKDVVEIERKNFRNIVEKISQNGDCRYPLLAIRILVQAITNVDGNGKTYMSARQLSKSLDVNYDTVTKCLKFLRNIDVLQTER